MVLALALPAGAQSLDDRVDSTASDLARQFEALGRSYGLAGTQILTLSDHLSDDDWAAQARRMGVPKPV